MTIPPWVAGDPADVIGPWDASKVLIVAAWAGHAPWQVGWASATTFSLHTDMDEVTIKEHPEVQVACPLAPCPEVYAIRGPSASPFCVSAPETHSSPAGSKAIAWADGSPK